MKNIVLILALMLGFSRVAAQVTETGGGNIPQALTTVFQNVDMAQVPTGLLMSKSIYFTNIHDYSGTTLSEGPLSKNIKIPP